RSGLGQSAAGRNRGNFAEPGRPDRRRKVIHARQRWPVAYRRKRTLRALTATPIAISRSRPSTDNPLGASAGMVTASTNPNGRLSSAGGAGIFAQGIPGIVRWVGGGG